MTSQHQHIMTRQQALRVLNVIIVAVIIIPILPGVS